MVSRDCFREVRRTENGSLRESMKREEKQKSEVLVIPLALIFPEGVLISSRACLAWTTI